jgi:hypothetical protein
MMETTMDRFSDDRRRRLQEYLGPQGADLIEEVERELPWTRHLVEHPEILTPDTDRNARGWLKRVRKAAADLADAASAPPSQAAVSRLSVQLLMRGLSPWPSAESVDELTREAASTAPVTAGVAGVARFHQFQGNASPQQAELLWTVFAAARDRESGEQKARGERPGDFLCGLLHDLGQLETVTGEMVGAKAGRPVDLVGRVLAEHLARLFRRHGLGLSPGRKEPFSMTLREWLREVGFNPPADLRMLVKHAIDS